MFEQSGAINKAAFIKNFLFQKPFKVLRSQLRHTGKDASREFQREESHYELLDIVDYLFLHNSLVNICKVSNTDFLGVYKGKQIFVLEHIESFDRIAAILDCYAKV